MSDRDICMPFDFDNEFFLEVWFIIVDIVGVNIVIGMTR
jgi:hypothetical protein